MEEQYCLKWNNHQTTLLTVLTGLMDTERLADCILSAEGKSLKAHQVIISACSPYLERLLNETRQPGYMPILIFSDLAYDELVAMKEYMYKGEVNIRQDALDSFLKAACNLQIKGLADGGGGGGSDEGGGGSKRKAPPDIADSPVRAGRRRRRESRESDNQEMLPEQLAQPMPAKKQNVFTAKVEPFEPAPVVKMEPIMDQPPMPQPQIQHTPQLVMKPEPQDQPEPETHDLTGLDDDEDYDYEMPGTSQPDLSQDISSWQMDNSMHSAEDFAASQSMNTSASQPGQSSQVVTRIHNCGRDWDQETVAYESSGEDAVSKHQCPFCCTYRVKDIRDFWMHLHCLHTNVGKGLKSGIEGRTGNKEMEVASYEKKKCPWCSYEYIDVDNFAKHVSRKHPQFYSRDYFDSLKNTFLQKPDEIASDGNSETSTSNMELGQCPYCPYKINDLDKFDEHLSTNHRKKCRVSLLQRLRGNLPQIKDEKPKNLQMGSKDWGKCPYCSYKISDIDKFDRHLSERHRKKCRVRLLEKMRDKASSCNQCPYCAYKLGSIEHFIEHLIQEHTDTNQTVQQPNKKPRLQTQAKRDPGNESRTKPEVQVSGSRSEADPRYFCDLCTFKSKRKIHLLLHLTQHMESTQ